MEVQIDCSFLCSITRIYGLHKGFTNPCLLFPFSHCIPVNTYTKVLCGPYRNLISYLRLNTSKFKGKVIYYVIELLMWVLCLKKIHNANPFVLFLLLFLVKDEFAVSLMYNHSFHRYLSGGTFENMEPRSLNRCPSTTSVHGLGVVRTPPQKTPIPIPTITIINKVYQVSEFVICNL